MPGGKGKIGPSDGKQFSAEYQPAEKWTEKRAIELADELLEWISKDGNIFFEDFLVIQKKLYPEIIAYLSKKHTSFLKRLKHAEKIQEIKLAKYGVEDKTNASVTKFVLQNKHGWVEKSERKSEVENRTVLKIGDREITI